MNINFTKGNIEITPSMQNHAESKLGRLARHLENISHIDVTVGKQGDGFHVEALVHNEKAHFPQVHAKSHEEDYHSAIDQLEAKLMSQIDTLRDKRRRGRRHATKAGAWAASDDEPGDKRQGDQ